MKGKGAMSFDFYLYRASPGLPAINDWEKDHAEPLGTPAELRARVSELFPGLTWRGDAGGRMSALGQGLGESIELSLGPNKGPFVQFVVTYTSPPVLRKLMEALGLNYCCTPESGELRDPFSVGDNWRTSP